MSTSDLVDVVREAAAGTPYVVEEQPYGFALRVNVVDAQWYTLLRRNGVRRVFSHEVRLDEGSRTISVTDVAQTVRWDAGTSPSSPPSLHAERSFQRGRVHQFSAEKRLGVDATGKAGMPVDYTFRAGEGRELVRRAARQAGWSERMGGEQKGALVLAASLVVIGVLVGLFFLVKALFG